MPNSEKPVTVTEIYNSLYKHFYGYVYRISNVFIFARDWETDFFCINRSGFSFEMEIKMSRKDFKIDFKKNKHQLISERSKTKLIPNRFYFVTPMDLISIDEVPEYAGLIYVRNGHLMIMKKAPFIHKIKYDFRRKLCDKFYHRWIDYKYENKQLISTNKQLIKELEMLKSMR